MDSVQLQKLAQRAKSGKPYVVVQLKEHLERLPVEDAYRQYCRLLGIDNPGKLVRARARAMLPAARDDAMRYVEIEAGGMGYANAPPRVVGDGNHRALFCTSRADYVACFANAEVGSLSSAIIHGGQMLFDFEDWEFDQIGDRLILDSRVFRGDGREIWRIEATQPARHLASAFTLLGCHTRAFGHWMWEYLPKYLSALDSEILPPMPVLIDAGMPAQHRQALELALPAGAEIIEVPLRSTVRVGELWCAPAPVYMPLYERLDEKYRWDIFCSPPWRFTKPIGRLVRALGEIEPVKPWRKVYLARPENNHRQMVNGKAIEAIAGERGFEIIFPETMSFRQQAELLRQASHVMGPEGSAMFLTFFLQAGAKVAILSHPDIEGLPTFTAIIDELGIDTTIVTGPFHEKNQAWPQFSSYVIDVEKFREFIDGWLDG